MRVRFLLDAPANFDPTADARSIPSRCPSQIASVELLQLFVKFLMEERQKSLWDKIKFNHLNLWKRDATIQRTIREHRQKGLASPYHECRQDVENLRKGWKWEESLLDGGMKIRIGVKAFYVAFNSDGNLQRFTPWDNYLAEIQND